jgi:hypothetical protein
VRAVLFGRNVLHVDTNFYYAEAGLHVPSVSFHWWFATYYFLALLSLFVHFGCAAWRRLQRQPPRRRALAVALPAAAGALIAALIVMTLAGAFYRVTIPPEYQRMPPPGPYGRGRAARLPESHLTFHGNREEAPWPRGGSVAEIGSLDLPTRMR